MARKNATDVKNFFVMGRKGSTLYITGSLFALSWGFSNHWDGRSRYSAVLPACGGVTGSIGLIVLVLLCEKSDRETGLYTLPEIATRQYNRWVGLAVCTGYPSAC